MKDLYTIGTLAKEVGLPAKTIRYYEEIELITPAKRGSNGYRLYDDESVNELHLIKYARDLGLPIETMKKLMKGCGEKSCHHTKSEMETEIESYISLLNQKIFQLTTLRNKLKQLEEKICVSDTCDDPKYCCNILHQLTKLKGGE